MSQDLQKQEDEYFESLRKHSDGLKAMKSEVGYFNIFHVNLKCRTEKIGDVCLLLTEIRSKTCFKTGVNNCFAAPHIAR